MVKRVKRRTQYPCSTCGQHCEVQARPAVFCGECSLWFHADCQHLTNACRWMSLKAESHKMNYLCSSCLQQDGCFNYHASLQRLAIGRRGRLTSLRSAVIVERILLRNRPLNIPTNESVDIRGLKINYTAQTLIDQLGKNRVIIRVIPIYILFFCFVFRTFAISVNFFTFELESGQKHVYARKHQLYC